MSAEEVEVVQTITIPTTRLGERQMLGLRQPWLSGEADDGVTVEVDTAAGFGGGWFSLTLRLPDGRSITEIANLRPIIQEWADRLRATLEAEK